MTRTEKLLRELIALPSVNPAFLPPRHPHGGERRVAEFLVAIAAKAGLDIEFRPVVGNRANMLARLTPSGSVKHRLVLAPHLDTVNAASPDQFLPVRKAGRIYGRGACDTKGSVAAMLRALGEVASSPRRPKHTELLFIGLVDEECQQLGSRAVAESGLEADLAIVGEPTLLKVVTAHKGDLWLNLQTTGRAAHGATPHLGRNAVLRMARVVETLETDYAAQLKNRRHPLLGSPTVNVGTIRGGSQANIVPEQCAIEIDRRTLPGETVASARREIRAVLKSKGLKAKIGDVKGVACPALETDPKLPWVRRFMSELGQRRPAGVHYFCDAAVLASGGIPSVVFGPGDIAQAHTDDEWIDTQSLNSATRRLRRFLESLP